MSKIEPVEKAADAETTAGFTLRCDEDEVACLLLRPRFAADREIILLAGFDAFERLTSFEPIDGRTASRCTIAPQRWRAVLTASTRYILMAHNHPSGDARPSRTDIDCTREAAAFLAILGVDLLDHLIFTGDGHFSFHRAGFL